MRYPESDQLPVTLPDKPFPVGDVTDGSKTEIANDWLTTINGYDLARLENYVQYTSRPKSSRDSAADTTHAEAMRMCEDWDYYRGDVMQRSKWGFMVVRSFLNETRFLPGFDIDLSEEIEQMKQGRQVEKAQAFGQAAWIGMEHSHPKVFEQFKRLLDMMREPLYLELDEGEEFFIAGMMVPYMLSYVASLENDLKTNDFTGMAIGSVEQLEAMNFADLFTRETKWKTE